MHGTVRSLDWLTPHYARIVLEGAGLEGFDPLVETDAYINVAIPPTAAPYAAPFDLDELKELPREQRPFRRRWTVRGWDPAARHLTLEVVVHGDTGAGGPWVAAAQPGDALVFTGPAGGYRPDPSAAWHLLAGDESALPAIAASLEALPAEATAHVLLVCDGPDYEVELTSPAANLHVSWLHRTGDAGGDEDLLADAVVALGLHDGAGGHAFVHGEAAEIRAVRRHLLAEVGMDPQRLSCSPYWRRGLTDEEWRQIKAAWNAEVAADVPV